ncbi:MAG TPA: hypothetical protein DHV05_08430 [Acholeplasmataceae bacterium]|nr:hypothetical protein [Acholeplasmataceae bacterium]
MKKCLSLVLVCMLFLFNSFQSYAFNEVPLERVNYLDLSQLVYDPIDIGSAYTNEPMSLKPNTTFTFVVSRNFLGEQWDSLSNIEIEIEEFTGSYYFAGYLTKDDVNQRAYITFTTTEGLIHLYGIPVKDLHNYDIMVYEGEYTDFPGFVPYHEDSEQLEYFGVLPLDVDSQPTLEVIQSYVVAKNPFGVVIPTSLVYDDYSISEKKPGTYQMVFETIYHQIKKRYYLDVRVFDLVAPIMTLETNLAIPINERWTIDQVKQAVTLSDNVDSMSYHDLVVVSDTYTPATTIGSYQITLEATDSSGNTSTLNIPIQLIDIEGPVIQGPSSIYLYATDTPLTNVEVQQKLLINDDVDGSNVTVNLITNHYNQQTIPGVYQMTFEAKDQAQNSSTFDILIHVIENRGPVFEQSDLILNKTTADQMTEAEMITWLREQLLLSGLHATDIIILYNEYEEHNKESGSYYVYLSYQVDGSPMTSRIRIDVEEKPSPILSYAIPASAILLIGSGIFIWIKRKKM